MHGPFKPLTRVVWKLVFIRRLLLGVGGSQDKTQEDRRRLLMKLQDRLEISGSRAQRKYEQLEISGSTSKENHFRLKLDNLAMGLGPCWFL